MNFISNSLQDTEDFAKEFSKQLCEGATVLFYGDLGAGKTTLCKSIVKELGYQGRVTSPTFTIVNQYQGRMPIYHCDMYRLEGIEEAIEVGIDEFFKDEQGVCLVEWPEKVEQILPKKVIKVHIEVENNTRKFTVENLK